MTRPVSPSDGSKPSLPASSVGPDDALPPSAMVLTSTKAARVAQEEFSKRISSALAPKTAYQTVEGTMAQINPVIDVIVETRDFVKQVAVRVDKVTSRFFATSKAWEYFFTIDGGLFNILSLFRRGMAFSSAVNEAAEIWTYCSPGEKLQLLSDTAFKALRVGESALALTDKILVVLEFVFLALPLTCLGIITSFVIGVKALITAVKLERQRQDFLQNIGSHTGRERIDLALSYIEHYEAEIDKDNEAQRTRLVKNGASPTTVERFLSARKKWSLTGRFGSKNYISKFQGFKRLSNELKRLDEEIKQAAVPSELGRLQVDFLNKRRLELVGEANLFVDQFVNNLAVERSQQAVSCIASLMMTALFVITLVAALVTIQYWAPAAMALAIVAAFIMMLNSLYTLWQKSYVTFEEKEGAIDLVTAHFTQQMLQAKDVSQKIALASMFGFTLNADILENNKLLAKHFEEHLKGVLHQEKVQQYINRSFVDAVAQQVKTKSEKTPLSALKKFERDMTPFLQMILPQGDTKKVIERHLAHIVATPDTGMPLEDRLASAFFHYLNQDLKND